MVGEMWVCFVYPFIPHLQLDAEDFTALRDGSTTKLKDSEFLNHHFPLIGKYTMDCYMSKK